MQVPVLFVRSSFNTHIILSKLKLAVHGQTWEDEEYRLFWACIWMKLFRHIYKEHMKMIPTPRPWLWSLYICFTLCYTSSIVQPGLVSLITARKGWIKSSCMPFYWTWFAPECTLCLTQIRAGLVFHVKGCLWVNVALQYLQQQLITDHAGTILQSMKWTAVTLISVNVMVL